jgi:hypothetical protein
MMMIRETQKQRKFKHLELLQQTSLGMTEYMGCSVATHQS